MTPPPEPRTPTARWLADQLHDDATAFLAMTSRRLSIRNLVEKVNAALPKIEAEAADAPLREALTALAADLVNDHRGILYDVIERIEKIAALTTTPAPDPLDVEQVKVALKADKTVRALIKFKGHFNEAWWDRFAEELLVGLTTRAAATEDTDAL